VLALVTLLTIVSVDQGPRPVEPAPRARIALVATGVSLVSAALGLTSGVLIDRAMFRAKGVPQLGWFSVMTSLVFLGTAALTHLVVPAALPLADGGDGHGSPRRARERGFLYALVPLSVGTLGCVGLFVSAALETARFGEGQGLLIAGLVAIALSAIAHQVLEIIGASRGYAEGWVAPWQ